VHQFAGLPLDDAWAGQHPLGAKEKSYKGQRHKGCGLCDMEKRAGNGAERRPARDRRQLEAAKAQEDEA